MTTRETVEEIEALIRRGQLAHARQLFRSLPLGKIRDEHRLQVANFARRLDRLPVGLRLLRPQVFERRPRDLAQHQRLIAEYAILLLQNGNIHEAKEMLIRIERVLHVDVFMAKAWSHFEHWEYEESIPHWKRYIELQRNPYWNCAGRINLSEAQIATGSTLEALSQLDLILRDPGIAGHERLMANALHLRARAYFELNEFKKSNRALKEASRLFGDRIALDASLIRRQIAINEAFERGDERPLLDFRREANLAGAWESVRECDFQRLRLNFRSDLFDLLYLGTPLPAYRKHLARTFQYQPASQIEWGDPSGHLLNLQNRTFRLNTITRQNAALLEVLLLDLYRPPSVGEIFAALFKGEHFHPATSAVRIHQAIQRLRSQLAEANIPLKIEHKRHRYHLVRTKPISLIIQTAPVFSNSMDSWQNLAIKRGTETPFTVRDVQELFRISKATAKRRIAEAQSDGLIVRTGAGRSTGYRLSDRHIGK